MSKPSKPSRARRRNVTSKDPRKDAVKAALIAKAGGGARVTCVTEDCVEHTFSGRVLAYNPSRRAWSGVGGPQDTYMARGKTVTMDTGAHTVPAAAVELIMGGTRPDKALEAVGTGPANAPTTDAEQEALADAGDPSVCEPGDGNVRVVVMEPGQEPREKIVGSEDALKETGGYAMVLGRWALGNGSAKGLLPSGCLAYVREFDFEGQAQRLGVAENFRVLGHSFHGPLVVVGTDAGGTSVSMSAASVADTLELLLKLERHHG